jgi:hypothetical protein
MSEFANGLIFKTCLLEILHYIILSKNLFKAN